MLRVKAFLLLTRPPERSWEGTQLGKLIPREQRPLCQHLQLGKGDSERACLPKSVRGRIAPCFPGVGEHLPARRKWGMNSSLCCACVCGFCFCFLKVAVISACESSHIPSFLLPVPGRGGGMEEGAALWCLGASWG